MQDVRDFCSRLTILRNGRAVGSHLVPDMSDGQVIELMIGRSLDIVFPAKPARPAARSGSSVALSARDFTTTGLRPVSFDLSPGQTLGVAALQGMGQRELFLGLFGAQPRTGGALLVHGMAADFRSPADAIDPRFGVGLVPEDRKTEGLFLNLDGRENTALPSLRRFTRSGLVERRKEQAAVARALAAVQVAARALWTPVKQLSGGNQQKIILGKWLLTGGRILLLYDPTRGVDVGTKAEIYRLMRSLRRRRRRDPVLFHRYRRAGQSLRRRPRCSIAAKSSIRSPATAITDTRIMRAGGRPDGARGDVGQWPRRPVSGARRRGRARPSVPRRARPDRRPRGLC